jgi:hypothetical protein
MLGELEKLMVMVGDGHSYIIPISLKFPSYYLPIQFYLFSDGVFIINADSANKSLIGAKLLGFNNVPINKMLGEMNKFVHRDNKFTIQWFAPTVLRFRGYHEQYGLKQNASEIPIKLVSKGKIITKTLAFVPPSDFRGIPKLHSSIISSNAAPLYLSKINDNYWFTYLDDATLYFQFNQVYDKETETIEKFSKRLETELGKMRVKKLIIDVRHNNGGNAGLLNPLVSVVANFEKQSKGSKIF